MQPGYIGTIMNLQIVLTPKNLYLNHATLKNMCQNFSTPKNPLIIPVTWNPEYWLCKGTALSVCAALGTSSGYNIVKERFAYDSFQIDVVTDWSNWFFQSST